MRSWRQLSLVADWISIIGPRCSSRHVTVSHVLDMLFLLAFGVTREVEMELYETDLLKK